VSLFTLTPLAQAEGSQPQPVVPMDALAHAAATLESSTGGKTLEIRLADEKGDPAFEAALAKDDAVVYMRIASVGDNVTEIQVKDLPPWLLDYHMEAYLRSVNEAKIPITVAIAKAQARAGAPAIGAGIAKPLSGTNAVLAYYVETIQGTRRKTLAVDAKSGNFISNPDSLFEPYTPVKLARRLGS
jgi:uncharacterized membrane protein YkoI